MVGFLVRERFILANAMTRVHVTESRPDDWAYLSEGGSSIVFSYTGPVHPDFTGKVLRLRKTSLSAASDSVGTTDEKDDPVIAFQNSVVAALVPSTYLPDLEVVLLDAQWLATLEALRHGDRPTERRVKDQIDRTRQKGILATDLIGDPDILAIEIKVWSELLYKEDIIINHHSLSGVSCPISLTCPGRLRRSRCPLAGSVCILVSGRKREIFLLSTVLWISTRTTKHALGRLSVTFGTAGCRAMTL